jgi:choice-of-anchor B domain-containing protein
MRPCVSIFFFFCLSAYYLGAQDSKNFVQIDRWYAPNMVPDGHTAWYNEVWGFTQNGSEYAVIGSRNGTHILEVTNEGLTEKFFVPGASQGIYISNRDFMDHNGYLYAVCDQGYASLQIVDLHNLPQGIEVVYDSDTLINRAHTVWIDKATNKMYIGGPAGFAMKVFDISNPVDPQLLYTHTAQGYIHDMFVRNDTAFLNAGYEGLHLYDFSNMASPVYYGGLTGYTNAGYNHSGKLSADGKWYVFTDETDGKKVKLYHIDDLTDLEQAALFSSGGDANTIAHDAIWKGNYIFVAYYYDGLVVFDARNKNNPEKVAWFNPYTGDHYGFRGNWGVYVLPSGKVLMSDQQNGLYLLEFLEPPAISGQQSFGIYPNPLNVAGYFYYDNGRALHYRLDVFDVNGQKVFSKDTPTNFLQLNGNDFVPGIYGYRFYGLDNDTRLEGKIVVAH